MPAGRSRAESSSRWARARCGPRPPRSRCSPSIGIREKPTSPSGILESRKLPPDEVCQELAAACGVEAENLTLLVAPTASMAGTVQVVARSVETALHKLFELGFDLTSRRERLGARAVAAGRRRRSGGHRPHERRDPVRRRGDAVGPRRRRQPGGDRPAVPSGASPDHGQPFAAIFERYRPRLLQDRSAPVQPGGRDAGEPGHGALVSLRPHAAARDSRVVRSASRLARNTVGHHQAVELAMHFAVLVLAGKLVSARTSAGRGAAVTKSRRCSFAHLTAAVERRRPGIHCRRDAIWPASTPCWSARCRRARSSKSCFAWICWPASKRRASWSSIRRGRSKRPSTSTWPAPNCSRRACCMPRTVVCQTVDDAMAAFRALGGDVVVKPLFGAEGRGIARLDRRGPGRSGPSACWCNWARCFTCRNSFRMMDSTCGCWSSGERMWGMRRRNPLDWRTNVSRGADGRAAGAERRAGRTWRAARPMRSEPRWPASICCPAATASCTRIEVNAVPGWQALSRDARRRRRPAGAGVRRAGQRGRSAARC